MGLAKKIRKGGKNKTLLGLASWLNPPLNCGWGDLKGGGCAARAPCRPQRARRWPRPQPCPQPHQYKARSLALVSVKPELMKVSL